jgi:hypothetical protein
MTAFDEVCQSAAALGITIASGDKRLHRLRKNAGLEKKAPSSKAEHLTQELCTA